MRLWVGGPASGILLFQGRARALASSVARADERAGEGVELRIDFRET